MEDIKNIGFKEESKEEMENFFKDPEYIHFIGMIYPRRPGVMLCTIRMEHEHYKPGTDSNKNFHIRMINWENTEWMIVSIPKKDCGLMKKMAKECGLRIADGVPTIIGGDTKQITQFPINNKNVFTFENASDSGVYSGKYDVILEEENIQIKKILNSSNINIGKNLN